MENAKQELWVNLNYDVNYRFLSVSVTQCGYVSNFHYKCEDTGADVTELIICVGYHLITYLDLRQDDKSNVNHATRFVTLTRLCEACQKLNIGTHWTVLVKS